MSKPTIASTNARIDELEQALAQALERIATMEAAAEAELTRKAERKANRDYGPKSKRKTTRKLALACALRLKRGEAVKDIADRYGLSRGQVYSLRGGYTWTNVLEQVGLEPVRK